MKLNVLAAAISGAIAAAYLTLHQGMLIGMGGGAVIGGLVGILVWAGTRGRKA